MKYKKLKARIFEIYGQQILFAQELGITPITLSSKLNGKIGISTEEVYKWCKLLKIRAEEIAIYFFPEMFNENEVESQQ